MNLPLFGIVVMTKNTYSMLEQWYGLYDYKHYPILNIDLNSQNKEKKNGIKICEKLGINFVECNKTDMQNCLDQALEYFKNNHKIEWLLYMHHDAYPMEENALCKLNQLIDKSKKLVNYGVIGFNIYHDGFDLNMYQKNNNRLMTTARTPLELGNGYYSNKKTSRVDYSAFDVKPFVVESIMWSTALINYHQYKNNIIVDENFNFFQSWDDIAFQFLYQNIYNIVIPSISFAHDQSLKLSHSLPRSSPNSILSVVQKLYGRFDHLTIWKRKWKFSYSLSKVALGGDSFLNHNQFINKLIEKIASFVGFDFSSNFETVARKTYKKYYLNNLSKCKLTLIDKFYEHDPKFGPMKYIKLK